MSDTQSKANNGDYKNELEYPKKQDFQKVFVYSKGKVVENGLDRSTIGDEMIKAWRAAGNTVEISDDPTAYRAATQAYGQETARLEAQFRADLTDEYGMTGHPKADLLFSKAWQMGHSAGYGEVASYYDDLVDLVK